MGETLYNLPPELLGRRSLPLFSHRTRSTMSSAGKYVIFKAKLSHLICNSMLIPCLEKGEGRNEPFPSFSPMFVCVLLIGLVVSVFNGLASSIGRAFDVSCCSPFPPSLADRTQS